MLDFEPLGRDGHVLGHVEAGTGHLVLNRPRAINALSTDMVRAVKAQLDRWAGDGTVTRVLLTGAGERGLCAGGDVRAVREGIADPDSEAAHFLPDEYAMDATIADYTKPFVAWMDGIVMGGGLGISAHAGHRLVTERSKVAMPETIIGFYPDVGMLWRLAGAPGETGTHLALTGSTIGGADAVAIGFADLLVDSDRLDDLVDLLHEGALPDAGFGDPDPPSSLLGQRSWIDDCYAGDDASTILQRLESHGSPQAAEAANTIRSRSPWSVTVTLAALRRAHVAADVDEVLAMDTLIAPRMATHPDFAEGVRAQLVDKDFTPHWREQSLSEVDVREVERLFQP